MTIEFLLILKHNNKNLFLSSKTIFYNTQHLIQIIFYVKSSKIIFLGTMNNIIFRWIYLKLWFIEMNIHELIFKFWLRFWNKYNWNIPTPTSDSAMKTLEKFIKFAKINCLNFSMVIQSIEKQQLLVVDLLLNYFFHKM